MQLRPAERDIIVCDELIVCLILFYRAKATQQSLGFDEAVALIKEQGSSSYLTAVRQSGRLLYRGQTLNNSAAPALIKNEPYDLLDVTTYPTNGAIVADYFRSLDQRLTQLPRYVAATELFRFGYDSKLSFL
jgi:hypothetical protein